MENVNELYNEVVDRAKADGAVTQEAWDGIVEEVVEEFRSQGMLDDDDPTEGLEDVLRARFPEYDQGVRQGGL
jgi:hypothetical protein